MMLPSLLVLKRLLPFAVNTGDQITNSGMAEEVSDTDQLKDTRRQWSRGGSPAQTSITTAITAMSCPSCQPPTSPIDFGITPSTVDYSFTDGNGLKLNNYEISYGATGFTPGVLERLFRLIYESGFIWINCSNCYDVYVRAICAVGDTSPWSAVSSFTTAWCLCGSLHQCYFSTFLL